MSDIAGPFLCVGTELVLVSGADPRQDQPMHFIGKFEAHSPGIREIVVATFPVAAALKFRVGDYYTVAEIKQAL